jgi:hypothetical protein
VFAFEVACSFSMPSPGNRSRAEAELAHVIRASATLPSCLYPGNGSWASNHPAATGRHRGDGEDAPSGLAQ